MHGSYVVIYSSTNTALSYSNLICYCSSKYIAICSPSDSHQSLARAIKFGRATVELDVY